MRAKDRRNNLLEWLEKDGNLGLAEMAEHFNVSKMTIHRDLEYLEKRGQLSRIHGGALRSEKRTRDEYSGGVEPVTELKCLVCGRQPSQQLMYILNMKGGERKVACCPHCGISAHLMFTDEVVMALTADFLTGKLHSAQHSFFIMGGVVDHCCKPSVLTFDSEEMALRFQKGFGGSLGRFSDALDYLRKDISMHSASSCPKCSSSFSLDDIG